MTQYDRPASALPPYSSLQPLQGVRILSLALNLPGPAALWRCAGMGARCRKIEPRAADRPDGLPERTADPMERYSAQAYDAMHHGIDVLQMDLKSETGQQQLHEVLAGSDVLLTSFRPGALAKLGLAWERLQALHPHLSMVRILGSTGPDADIPGHDLTYQAEAGLVQSLQMPPSLFADMAGALMASEAVLQCVLASRRSGHGVLHEVGLAQAAHWLALPWRWGLTQPHGDVGGAHAGYRIYPCADGIIAVAALEPHFAQRLCAAAGMGEAAVDMRSPATHEAIAGFMRIHSCRQLQALAEQHDIPMHPLAQ